ncbi:MAG: class I SAM-dependent methyltransferase [bacterium]|nr:class I SAM-dependent methyltransferase [bacterium]
MTNKEYTWAKAKAKDWKNYLPPTRPSISELAVIEEYFVDLVKSNPRKKYTLAILGCTVEFRSLVHKYGMEVTIIDFSKLHFEILSEQFMTYKGEEKFLEMDWRKMKSGIKFDFILGDLVVNMLDNENRELMLKNIHNMLAENGLAILRSWIEPKEKLLNFESVLKFVRKKYPNVNFYTSTAGYVYPAYINNSEFGDVGKLKNDLEDLKKKKLITSAEYNYWRDRLKYEIKGVAVPKLKVLNKQFSKYFKIKKMKQGVDIFSDIYKIHFLKKK